MEYAIGIVIIIVIIQFALHIIFYRNTTKELKDLRQKLPKESAARREERILALYSNIEELMEAFEEYVDETRAELSRFQKETAYRSPALPRVREKTAEVREAAKAAPEFRSQMSLPLPGTDAPDSGVILELNRTPSRENASDPPKPVQPEAQAARPAAHSPQNEPVQNAQVPPSSPQNFEESLDAYVPPSPKNLEKITVIRPLPTEASGESGGVSETDAQAVKRFATKPQKIRFLSSRGYHPDDIARELSIGKGEVEVVLRIDDTH